MSSEPSKTPEAANDIPETGTNETTILGAASTSLNEMPSTEKDLNGTLGLPLMRQCCFIQAFLTTKHSWHPLNI